MKPVKQSATKIIVIVPFPEHPQPPKQPRVNPFVLKAVSIIIITLISWLAPEASIAIFLFRLLFILLGWLNHQQK